MDKVGIIGFGKMGRIRFDTITSSNYGQVLKVYDKAQIEGDFDVAKNPDEIINDSEISSVFICTPNFLNYSLTKQALEAGKNVFCEKPPAFTSKEVQTLINVEQRSGKNLMYGFNHRHHASIKEMKRIIDSGEFGKVLWMRGRYGKSVDQDFFKEWRSKRELSGGGILIDQGIHMLDLFLYLGGDFDNVHAAISNLYWKLDVEDNVFATLRNSKTGLVASLHSTMTQWRHMFSLEVFLENGYLVINGLKTSSGTYGDEILTIAKNRSTAPAATWEDEVRKEYEVDDSWNSEILEFFESIRDGRKVQFGNSDDALKLMRLVDKIYSYRDEQLHPDQKTFQTP